MAFATKPRPALTMLGRAFAAGLAPSFVLADGLDEYEVRSRAGRRRHVTLSPVAMAFLTAVRLTTTGPERRRSKSRRR